MSVYRRLFIIAAAALVAPAVYAAAPKPDIENGKSVFNQQCKICHADSTEPDGPNIGPSLFGVVGRKAGSVADFSSYTAALKAYKVTWNAKSLDEFLSNPGGKVPGTMMPIPVQDAQIRTDIIAYLASLK